MREHALIRALSHIERDGGTVMWYTREGGQAPAFRGFTLPVTERWWHRLRGSLSTSVVLGRADERATERVIACARDVPCVMRLNLQDCAVGRGAINQMTHLSELQDLYLGGCTLPSHATRELAALRTLRSLHLSGTNVVDADVAAVIKLEGLDFIDLSKTRVTDSCTEVLRVHPALRTVRLRETEVSDWGMLTMCGKDVLSMLDVSGCLVTQEGVERAMQLAPLCEIQSDELVVYDMSWFEARSRHD